MAEQEYLEKMFGEAPDRPRGARDGREISLRVFRSGTELQGAIHAELETQLRSEEFSRCEACEHTYGGAVDFLVHQYLHLVQDPEVHDKIRKVALDKLHDIINPPKDAVLSGSIGGVLTPEEREEALQDPILAAEMKRLAPNGTPNT